MLLSKWERARTENWWHTCSCQPWCWPVRVKQGFHMKCQWSNCFWAQAFSPLIFDATLAVSGLAHTGIWCALLGRVFHNKHNSKFMPPCHLAFHPGLSHTVLFFPGFPHPLGEACFQVQAPWMQRAEHLLTQGANSAFLAASVFLPQFS